MGPKRIALGQADLAASSVGATDAGERVDPDPTPRADMPAAPAVLAAEIRVVGVADGDETVGPAPGAVAERTAAVGPRSGVQPSVPGHASLLPCAHLRTVCRAAVAVESVGLGTIRRTGAVGASGARTRLNSSRCS
jgi:hypothetical protein